MNDAVATPTDRRNTQSIPDMHAINERNDRASSSELSPEPMPWPEARPATSDDDGAWMPSMNALRCAEGFVVCVELAGMDGKDLCVQVEPWRLTLRGRRALPVPRESLGTLVHMLALEIQHGPFVREWILPEAVSPEAVRAEQCNGFLWVYLPLLR